MSSASNSSQRFEEAHFTFALTPQQVQQILTSRCVILPSFCRILGRLPWPLLSLLSAPLSSLSGLLYLLGLSFSCMSHFFTVLCISKFRVSVHLCPPRAAY